MAPRVLFRRPREAKPGLIHHSDRGVQYAPLVERLRSQQAHISMSAIGNPYDNAKAEYFFFKT